MPAAHTGLNVLSPGLATSVPCKKVATSLAGIRKLNPCTMAPPDAESVTASITPTSAASGRVIGQGFELPDAAGAVGNSGRPGYGEEGAVKGVRGGVTLS